MNAPRTSRPVFTWFLAACAAAALSSPADAFVLCARAGNGAGAPNEGASVKVRSVCKDNEVALDPSALGVTGASTTTIVRIGNPVTAAGSLSTPASCAAGELATGGGVLATEADGGVLQVRSSRPVPNEPGVTPTGWRVSVANLSDTGTVTATAYVVCTTTP